MSMPNVPIDQDGNPSADLESMRRSLLQLCLALSVSTITLEGHIANPHPANPKASVWTYAGAMCRSTPQDGIASLFGPEGNFCSTSLRYERTRQEAGEECRPNPDVVVGS